MSAEHSVYQRLSVPFSSLPHLLEYQARRLPNAPAILAPGRAALSYGRLYQHVEGMGHILRRMGIGRHDRMAIVLPNGPDMVVAILTVAATAVCAPLNPAYGIKELERYFADLRPAALITEAGFDSPARRVALSNDVRIVELRTADDTEAGLFTLTGTQVSDSSRDPVNPDDVALLLLTSGTTSWAKTVPLTHANICTSAYSSGVALALTETDRCLNVLPLFHGHGLIATVLTSLAAGASVVATPGCDVNSFFAWLSAFRPTWYSAVPTMHQAILTRMRRNHTRVAECQLRFVRSASAPLPPHIFAELERSFDTSVIEFYGMTETASSPIACNPLPPRQRKAGSVGKPVDLDVAIMDTGGYLLAGSETGEVVVRGASVMHGYDGNSVTRQAAFAGDWFKTGDLGFFDDDGFLFLTGRSREIINRGGEKITPWEVDEVILEHPAVADAVTFAFPHPSLGEDVGSAVVLRPHMAATPKEIRQFVVGRIADFKVPRKVLIVSEIPRGPTGKVQRIGLAAQYGLAKHVVPSQGFIAPRTPIEKILAECWAEILQVIQVGINDDFFALGGDSLLVTHLVANIHDILHLQIDISRFFEAPTVAETAHQIETLIQGGQAEGPSSIIARVSREDTAPASIAQERLWKLQQVLRDRPFFNVFCPLRLTSTFDTTLLERSINEVVRRHEILRTTFAVVDSQCVQVIAPQLAVHLPFDDLRELPESKKQTVGHQLVEEEALHSFDLMQGPLVRARLVRLAEREHLLLITMHGIIVDGWSLGVFVEELSTVYDAFATGATSPLAPLSIQYADFAHWQRRWQTDPNIVAQLAYWRDKLRDPLPVMRLAKPPRRQTIDSLRTARHEVILPASLSRAAKDFSAREGGTLYILLVAALKTLLQRYLGQDDLRVATLVANRNHPGTDALVGPLANTVILRTNLGGDPSLEEVMRRVRATALAAFANQDIPFEELVDALKRERALKPAALSQVMIALHNATLRPRVNFRHTLTFEEAHSNMLGPLVMPTTFDVSLMLRESTHGVAGSCIYKPHLFDAMTIDRLLRDFQEVLYQMVTRPERPISTIRVSLNPPKLQLRT